MSVMSFTPLPARRTTLHRYPQAASRPREGGPFTAFRLVLAGLMIHALASCGQGGDSGNIRLAIENASGMGIRCVAILAHFVTVDQPVIAAGDTHHLVLQRQSGGGLSIGEHGGEPMMLENLICGTDSAWSTSMRDLPLLALRSGERESWIFRCTPDGSRLACEP